MNSIRSYLPVFPYLFPRIKRKKGEEGASASNTIRSLRGEDYRRLAHHMLRRESEIIVNRAVRQRGLEGIWVVTIHDCLVTCPNQAERVKQLMVESFGTVGVNPTIK